MIFDNPVTVYSAKQHSFDFYTLCVFIMCPVWTRMRHIYIFDQVILDNPVKVYFAGQPVSGRKFMYKESKHKNKQQMQQTNKRRI